MIGSIGAPMRAIVMYPVAWSIGLTSLLPSAIDMSVRMGVRTPIARAVSATRRGPKSCVKRTETVFRLFAIAKRIGTLP